MFGTSCKDIRGRCPSARVAASAFRVAEPFQGKHWSSRLRFGSAAVDLLARPGIEIIDRVGHCLGAKAAERRPRAFDTRALQRRFADAEVLSCIGSSQIFLHRNSPTLAGEASGYAKPGANMPGDMRGVAVRNGVAKLGLSGASCQVRPIIWRLVCPVPCLERDEGTPP